MLDDFLKLLDRIIELLRSREHNRERFFREIVEPLYKEFEPVADDYFALFRMARSALDQYEPSRAGEASAAIAARREAMLAARQKVREVARVVRDTTQDEKAADFADCLTRFFYWSSVPTLGPVGGGFSSLGKSLAEVFNRLESHQCDVEEAREHVRRSEANLEEAWMRTAAAYAALRLHCLAPRL